MYVQRAPNSTHGAAHRRRRAAAQPTAALRLTTPLPARHNPLPQALTDTKGAIMAAADGDSPYGAAYAAGVSARDAYLVPNGGSYALAGLTAPRPFPVYYPAGPAYYPY